MKQLSVFLFLFAVVLFAAPAYAGVPAKVISETLEIAAKRSGRTLSKGMKVRLGKTLAKNVAKYGDDILPLVRKGGLEVVEQGARHGDDFWRLCRAVPGASRSLALHADQLLPLARRIGPAALKLEQWAPGLTIRVAKEFGDDGVKALAKAPAEDLTRLVGLASRADSPATRKMLLDCYCKSPAPGKFLDRLNWKHIMSAGLSISMITAAYKISDGVQETTRELGQKHPEIARKIISDTLAPFRYILYALVVLLLGPFAIARIKRCIGEAKKKNSTSLARNENASPPDRDGTQKTPQLQPQCPAEADVNADCGDRIADDKTRSDN